MKVVIAEKPSVGQEIAQFLKATTKKDGYMEGNGYQVTWAYGHLVELAPPDSYGFEKWDLETLPMIPGEFKLQVNSEGSKKKQFNTIKSLFKGCDEIIVATDAGREGELIFRYIYYLSGSNKPFKRLWLKSITEKAISEAFNDLKPGSNYDHMYYSAKCRSEADWLVGMNATRALTLTGQAKGVLSIGRVQTPVLVIICQRYEENKNFVKQKYYQIRLLLEHGEMKFKTMCVVDFKTLPECNSVLSRISGNVTLIKAVIGESKENAPALYDLSSLQQDCNKKFGFSAQKTLEIAQELYEKYKVLTYPRTGSRYLSEDIKQDIPGLFALLQRHPVLSKHAQTVSSLPLSKRPFNDAKVTDHHAIIITEVLAGNDVQGDHRKVYDLVATRLLAAFSESCRKQNIKYTFSNSDLEFVSTGNTILFEGWRAVETEIVEEGKENNEENQKLPILSEGDSLKIAQKETVERTTQPEAIHTEATLLHVMETAGKKIDDPDLREAMKEADAGLGTAATRAATIETLFDRGYIVREKSKLIPTVKGFAVYEIVKSQPIGNVELTGKWEKALGAINEGKLEPIRFMDEIKKFTGFIVQEFKDNVTQEHFITGYPDCPKCKKK